MKSVRISSTELDGYQYYLDSEEMTLEEMISRARKQDPPTHKQKTGSAWHKVLENPTDETLETVSSGICKFKITANAEIKLPQIRELKAVEPVAVINGIRVDLVGVADGINGNEVVDHKLTFRPDMGKFAAAWQWRCYLLLFKAAKFRYIVYSAKYINEPDEIEIYSVDEMTLYRYSGLNADVVNMLSMYIDFLANNCPERILTNGIAK